MAEERVVLQVKFEEAIGRHVAARAGGDTASSLVRANRERVGGLGRSSAVPVAAEIVSDFRKETRQRAGDLFDRLKDQKERIAAAKATATATRTTTSISAGGAAGGLVRAGGALLLGAAGGPLGIAAALIVTGLTAAATSAVAFSRQLKKATESATELSASVARAQGIRERDEFFARLRQARELGPDLANVVRVRSQADVALIELQTAFVKTFLPAALPFIEAVTDMLTIIAAAAKAGSKLADFDPGGIIEERLRKWGVDIKLPILIGYAMPVLGVIQTVLPMIADRIRSDEDKEGDEFERGLDEFLDPANFLPPLR